MVNFSITIGVVCSLALCVPLGTACAGSYKVLYSFQGGADGAYPVGSLVADRKGNLYGITPAGGVADSSCLVQGAQSGCGTVFKITPKGKEKVLYRFCSQKNCSDGSVPLGSLLIDTKGNLYGTTSGGGANGGGTAFIVTPKGKETVLYSFCSVTNCADGARPEAGLIADAKGNFYGTTYSGGAGTNPAGTAFELHNGGKETVLHSFCDRNCSVADGYSPIAPLLLKHGILYGTTPYSNNDAQVGGQDGAIFALARNGSEAILADTYTEGGYAYQIPPLGISSLIADKSGALYGTAFFGGTDPFGGYIFKITPDGTLSTVYNFCSQDCVDGQGPGAGLIVDKSGNLYGMTEVGGNNAICNNLYNGCGVVFKVTPSGSESVLYAFCSDQGCADGSYPEAGLLNIGNGKFFGTTQDGGAHNDGVIFELDE